MGDIDLGLSLSFPHHHHHHHHHPLRRRHHHHLQTTSAAHTLPLNLMTPPCLVQRQKQPPPSSAMEDALVSSDRIYETRAFFHGFDVNRPPSASTECEDEAGVSSPNSTVSTISGKRSERETNTEDPENERVSSCRGMSDEEDGENCRKKLRLSKEQSAVLEESFREHNTLNPVRPQSSPLPR